MDAKIGEIRARFESELTNCDVNSNSSESRFNPIDIDRVRSEDWQVRRYLLDSDGNVDLAYRSLLRTLEWKQSIGLHRLTEQYFATEFYSLYKLERCGRDLSGRPILTESFKDQRHWSELDATFRLLVAVTMEQMDRQAGPDGMCYLADLTGTPIHSFDIGLAKYRVDVLNAHYPLLARRIILNNVPGLLKPILKVVVALMAPKMKEAVVYTSTDQLSMYVDPKWLHVDVGGERREREYPTKTQGFRVCYARFSVKPAVVDAFFKYHRLD